MVLLSPFNLSPIIELKPSHDTRNDLRPISLPMLSWAVQFGSKEPRSKMRRSAILFVLIVFWAVAPRKGAQTQGRVDLCPTIAVACPDSAHGSLLRFTASVSLIPNVR